MDCKLVPIPPGSLGETEAVWRPFVEAIAKRSRCHVDQLLTMIRSGEVNLLVVWDADARQAVALAGTRLVKRGDDLVGEFVWMTGSGRRHWQPLLADLEAFHRDHLGCAGFRAVARPGWSPFLKAHGYRLTHVMMERDFNG